MMPLRRCPTRTSRAASVRRPGESLREPVGIAVSSAQDRGDVRMLPACRTPGHMPRAGLGVPPDVSCRTGPGRMLSGLAITSEEASMIVLTPARTRRHFLSTLAVTGGGLLYAPGV